MKFDLEWRLVYVLIVAGKSARFANNVQRRLHELVPEEVNPIIFLAEHPDIFEEARAGVYEKLSRAVQELAKLDLDLSTCGPNDLEAVHGIGPKTSRFFIVWTRPDERVAVLDRHILKWLARRGFTVPANTPANVNTYRRIEKAFLGEADRLKMSPRDLDLKIWGQAATAPNIA